MSCIALIDDEELVRESVAKLLNIRGYETISFESAEAFLDAEGYENADCLIVDFRLPGLNGCELLRDLREKSVTTPALLLSGNVDNKLESMLEGLPGVKTLGKPCLSQDLFFAVESCLEESDRR